MPCLPADKQFYFLQLPGQSFVKQTFEKEKGRKQNFVLQF